MDATLHLSDHLQDSLVADADRGVRLLGLAPANGPVAAGFEPNSRQLVRSPRSQPHRARGRAAAPEQQIGPGADERVHGECLYYPHFPAIIAPAAIAAVRWLRCDYLSRVCLLLWNKRQWHEETQRRLARRRYPPDRNGRGHTGDRKREQHRKLNIRRARILRGVPPLSCKKIRQLRCGQSLQP